MLHTILRFPAVKAETGHSHSTHYLRISQGLFTKPVSLGARAVGWPSNEVAAINAARATADLVIGGVARFQLHEVIEQARDLDEIAHPPLGLGVLGMLARLRPETRDLLVMRYIDDLPIGHIAQTTGKKKNAIYVALHRAVKELKELCAAPWSDT